MNELEELLDDCFESSWGEVEFNTTKAQEAIINLFLDIVGEDVDTDYERKEYGEMSRSFTEKNAQNKLRQYLRAEIKALSINKESSNG